MSLHGTEKNQGTFLRGWTGLKTQADTCTIFPYDIAYTPISSSFSSSSFLSILTLPLLNIRESELISCSFNFAMLFCTEIRLRLPFRSQSHISVEFFCHPKRKRAFQNFSIFRPIWLRSLVIVCFNRVKKRLLNGLKSNRHRL